MPKIKTKNGITLYYEQKGEGPDLVLISGLSADHVVWASLVGSLSKKYRVLTFDNRGVGQSDVTEGPYTIERMANDTAELMESLAMDTAAVLGQSMGGGILLQLCLSHPQKVERAILCTTAARLPYPTLCRIRAIEKCREAGINPELVFRLSFPWIFAEPFLKDEAKISEVMALLLNNPYPPSLEGLKGQIAACESFDLEKQLSKIQTKTLVIAGRDDLTCPLKHSEILHQQIAGSQLAIIDDCGHIPQFETPEIFENILEKFLQ